MERDSDSSDSENENEGTNATEFSEIIVGLLYLTPIGEEMPTNWRIIDQVRKRPPLGWVDTFRRCDKILLEISKDHNDEAFLPSPQFLFRAFHLTPLKNVKVVIIGQDPYPNEENACGLAFSVWPGVHVPASLQNIFKELKSDLKKFKIPEHGDLTYWASQGVLLLNKDLTVKPGKSGSCKDWWQNFLPEIIIDIRKANPRAIYVLWGRNAQELDDMIQAKKYIITGAHPSPMSADRGFFGGKYFSKINTLLKADKKEEINWQL